MATKKMELNDQLILHYSVTLNQLEESGEDNWYEEEFTGFSIEWQDAIYCFSTLMDSAAKNKLNTEQLKKYKDLFQRTQSIRPLLKKLDLEDPFDSLPADAQ